MDSLPDEIIEEIIVRLYTKIPFFKAANKRIRNIFYKILDKINSGNIDPEYYFNLIPASQIKYDLRDIVPSSLVMTLADILCDSNIQYGFYTDQIKDWDGDLFIIFRTRLEKDFKYLIKDTDYFVLEQYTWNSIDSHLDINYHPVSTGWKHFWNFLLDRINRDSILRFNHYPVLLKNE
jgi:hypothetical protein